MSSGLILEGGGMRGIFVAGVLDYFLDKGIRFDNVIGVSAGACHGCSFVAGQKGRAFATATDYLDDPEYCSLESLRKTGDMFGADFIYHRLPEELYPIDNDYFLKSGVKFQAVMTDCISGKPVYPVISDLHKDMEYVRASSSLPLLARMVPIDGGVYLDGGLTDSVPLKQSMQQGNVKNVVVLTRERGYSKIPGKMNFAMEMKYKRYPKLVEAIRNRYKMYNDTMELIDAEEALGHCFVIAPMGPLHIGRTEKNVEKLTKAYREGYFVAEGLGDKLAEYLSE
jgi:Predicted esterase of the alpha-beta hydrolase superfamily